VLNHHKLIINGTKDGYFAIIWVSVDVYLSLQRFKMEWNKTEPNKKNSLTNLLIKYDVHNKQTHV
jgi:hypothetical protein